MHKMKLVKCRPIRSDYRPVIPWKTSGYLITWLPCFRNSWQIIQRNFKREMASSSAGPRTLLFIFDEPKILARSKSSATTTLWTLQIRRVYPWVHRAPRRSMCHWMNILIFTRKNWCDESSKLPWTKIVQKSKYNKTKLRYLQLNVSLSFLAGLSGILLSFAIVGTIH